MRYKLQESENNLYVCTDLDYNIVCTWKIGAFNQTQKFTELDDITVNLGAAKIATVIREMTDWLYANHKSLVIIDYREHIAKRLKQLRQDANITQEELAIRSGILRSNLARIENGKYNVTIETLGLIAEALGKKIDLIDKY